jgi:hypothetical protein
VDLFDVAAAVKNVVIQIHFECSKQGHQIPYKQFALKRKMH